MNEMSALNRLVFRSAAYAAETESPCDSCHMSPKALCQSHGSEVCAGIRRRLRMVSFHKDQVIAREGEPQAGFLAVSEGLLRLCRNHEDGERSILALVHPGEIVAHGLPGASWHADLEGVTGGRLCFLDNHAFQGLRRLTPEIDDHLLAEARASLVKAHKQIDRLRQRTAESRLAAFLIELLDDDDETGSEAGELSIPMLRCEIADYLGLKTETVSRAFTRLAAKGVIALPQPSRVTVRDRDRLDSLAGES